MTTTRFAPSPTGPLHLGHAYSAWLAKEKGDRFLLRIEDIDQGRVRQAFVDGIETDLAWLGLTYERPILKQSSRFGAYEAALETLKERGVLYPCFCTRKDIAAEIARSHSAPHGPDGALYPGICRRLDKVERAERLAAGEPAAWRLDVAAACAQSGPLTWLDQKAGTIWADPASLGDVVLARKDTPTSYHLSSVLDDAYQGIDLVVRGQDLFHATHIHRLLQALLGLPVPIYHHHGLITNEAGTRLAKRDKAETLAELRAGGMSKEEMILKLLDWSQRLGDDSGYSRACLIKS